MSRLLSAVVVVCLVAGCQRSPSQVSAPNRDTIQENQSLANLIVGAPFRHANLMIFPVSSKEPKTEDRFISLDEGLKAGTIEVFEAGAQEVQSRASNTVGRVLVSNRSNKPLYLMPGEIILGGDQDRCIGEELVIQPSEQPVPIKVFCVEHGRWGGRAEGQTAAYLETASSNAANAESVSLPADLATDLTEAGEQANRGKFIATVGNVNKVARLAVQDGADQGKVWDEVASVNAKSGVKAQTGTFTGNYVDVQSVKRLEPYIAQMQQVGDSENIVGVIVAINGKVQTMDVFESTPLFAKLWPKLLKSYALDAANASQAAAGEVCSRESAREFLTDALQADVQESDIHQGVARIKRGTDRVVSFSAEQAQDSIDGMTKAMAAEPSAAAGVHTSAFSR